MWRVVCGMWRVVGGVWCMMCGVVCGVLGVVCDVRRVVWGVSNLMCCVWCANGVWSVVYGAKTKIRDSGPLIF